MNNNIGLRWPSNKFSKMFRLIKPQKFETFETLNLVTELQIN